MPLIIAGVDKDRLKLVSKSGSTGILHQGTYLTVEDGPKKFILRVEDTFQANPYEPSPLLVDMDLSPLSQDQKCQNIVYASRIMELPKRNDGESSFIKPQLVAKRSGQNEIDLAFGTREGVPVFPATAFSRSIQHLCSDDGQLIQVRLPQDFFFYQTLITGRTGSGKTVAMKYLAQYFLEELNGAALAVNVKEEDLLTMDKPSETSDAITRKEWSDLGLTPHGVETFKIYYPGHQAPLYSDSVDKRNAVKITLNTATIDPETLTGLVQNISELGADQLPNVFRFWKEKISRPGETLNDFLTYFSDPSKNREYDTMNTRGERGFIKMFAATYSNVVNALNNATEYFDVPDADELNATDILQPGKISVVDVTAKSGFGFGAVLLRDLLDKIYDAKSNKQSDVPVLVIIDEVHEFYGNARSREALQVLDSICRKGRSLGIGVIFASQNLEDMPKGITSVVNSRIYFKSDQSSIKSLGLHVSGFDPEAFGAGYGVTRIHEMSQLRFVKFPMSLAGVHDV